MPKPLPPPRPVAKSAKSRGARTTRLRASNASAKKRPPRDVGPSERRVAVRPDRRAVHTGLLEPAPALALVRVRVRTALRRAVLPSDPESAVPPRAPLPLLLVQEADGENVSPPSKQAKEPPLPRPPSMAPGTLRAPSRVPRLRLRRPRLPRRRPRGKKQVQEVAVVVVVRTAPDRASGVRGAGVEVRLGRRARGAELPAVGGRW